MLCNRYSAILLRKALEDLQNAKHGKESTPLTKVSKKYGIPPSVIVSAVKRRDWVYSEALLLIL